MGADSLGTALRELRGALAEVELPLQVPGAAEQRQEAAGLVNQLDDYILPRLARLDVPLLAVVGGSAGAGKSTVVNTLLGRQVSPVGAIRSATRGPALVHNPTDRRWFEGDRILPSLTRTTAGSTGAQALQLVAEPMLPHGLALLDAPGIDSLVDGNRVLAGQLLDATDLWLFVTSAARYADALPWDYLGSAVARGAAVAVVCNRVPPATMRIVPADLGRLMSSHGLAESPLFVIPETAIGAHGLLPDTTVSPIRTYLATLAADNQRREASVLANLDGAVAAIARRAPQIAEAARAQAEVVHQLDANAAQAFEQAHRRVMAQSGDGTLLRDEVLHRWHDYVGTSGFVRVVDKKGSWLRDRIARTFRGEPPQAAQAARAAGSALESLVREHGEAAAEHASLSWRGSPAGRVLIAARPGLARTSPDFPAHAAAVIREWQGDVLAMVVEQGKDGRRPAWIATAGVNGVGAALTLVIFARTAGPGGAERDVAAAAAQRLVESIFGEEEVRRLAEAARRRLDERVGELMDSELARYRDVLAGFDADADLARRVDDAVHRVVVIRSGEAAPDLAASRELPAPPLSGAAASRAGDGPVRAHRIAGVQGEVADAELATEDPPSQEGR